MTKAEKVKNILSVLNKYNPNPEVFNRINRPRLQRGRTRKAIPSLTYNPKLMIKEII
ncbi:MAG: hypothetical protein KF860_10985 [Cyclobacteriaceae bacterium]|nr:hypothetical protein [Cyclobacteriaceae bacterium]